MRLFISWSGERSKAVAIALRDWLPLVLPYVEPWLSEADIGAGERWARTMAQELADSNFGIVCITSENASSPWILFEAGALAKSLETSRVIPLLLDLEFRDISGPLAQFQAKKLARAGIEEVLDSLQSSAEVPIPEGRARQRFTVLWPELEKKLAEVPAGAPVQRNVRSQAEVLEELVASIRALDVRMRPSEDLISGFSRELKADRRPRLSPGMLRDIVGSVADGPYSPVVILIYSGFFRDELPWISEVALNAYRALTDRRRGAAREARRLIKVLEMSRYFLSDLSSNPRLANMVLDDFISHLQYYTKASALTTAKEESEN